MTAFDVHHDNHALATGTAQSEAEDRARSALALQLAGLRADGLAVTEPTRRVAVVESATASGV